jgi:hypothetical protein
VSTLRRRSRVIGGPGESAGRVGWSHAERPLSSPKRSRAHTSGLVESYRSPRRPNSPSIGTSAIARGYRRGQNTIRAASAVQPTESPAAKVPARCSMRMRFVFIEGRPNAPTRKFSIKATDNLRDIKLDRRALRSKSTLSLNTLQARCLSYTRERHRDRRAVFQGKQQFKLRDSHVVLEALASYGSGRLGGQSSTLRRFHRSALCGDNL